MAGWTWFALGSALFAGLTTILAKIGVARIPSTLATFIRAAVILVLIGLLTGLRREWRLVPQLNRTGVMFLILSGVTTGLSWLCYYHALQSGPASLVAPLDKLSLVVAVLLAVVLLGERLTVWQWCGASLMATGALLLAFKPSA